MGVSLSGSYIRDLGFKDCDIIGNTKAAGPYNRYKYSLSILYTYMPAVRCVFVYDL